MKDGLLVQPLSFLGECNEISPSCLEEVIRLRVSDSRGTLVNHVTDNALTIIYQAISSLHKNSIPLSTHLVDDVGLPGNCLVAEIRKVHDQENGI